MNFLLEIKLRQEAARRYNPVRETKKFERIIKRRSNWKNGERKPHVLKKPMNNYGTKAD